MGPTASGSSLLRFSVLPFSVSLYMSFRTRLISGGEEEKQTRQSGDRQNNIGTGKKIKSVRQIGKDTSHAITNKDQHGFIDPLIQPHMSDSEEIYSRPYIVVEESGHPV